MKAKFILCELARPLIRALPRGKHLVLGACGGSRTADRDWEHAPRRYRTFYDRGLGAYVAVDMALWQGRWHYFHGEYGDKQNPLLIKRFLRPGDTYVDIGANYGIHSLCASRVVGPRGRVYSFEPNPEVYDVLRAHLTINHIRNCTAHQVGLSDTPGTLTLMGGDLNTGAFTFRNVTDASRAIDVPVKRVDDVLVPADLSGRALIKIDTEGFEHRVIKGMPQLLEYGDLAVTLEMTDRWLQDTGSSARELIDDLSSRGFRGYIPRVQWRGLRRELVLDPLIPSEHQDPDEQYDAVFVKPRFLGE